jgi:hypothetical protein
MSTYKLFTVAGTSTHNGVSKARFANDLTSRVKILTKVGHTDIVLVTLPHPMTKLEAVNHLLANLDTGVDQMALSNKAASVEDRPAPKAKTAKATKKVAVKTKSTRKTAVVEPVLEEVAG